MKKKLTWAGLALLVLLALLQLTNPARTNPPVTGDFIASLHPPAPVAGALVASCYDCHSYQTQWPWYARLAPVSWLVVSDVNEGRQHLNLSAWPATDAKRAVRRLEEMSDQIGDGVMPPAKYTALHAGARLTGSQRKVLTDWLDGQADALSSSNH